MSDCEKKALVALEVKDAEQGTVEAVFSRFNVKDHDGDWTLPGAFEDGAPVRISAYGHGSWMGDLPVGRGTIKVTKNDARLVGQFFMSTPHGKATFDTVREMGDLQEWSYGFDVLETGELTDDLNNRGVGRVLQKLGVHEVSPVLLGAGIDTRTVTVKQYKRHVEEEEKVQMEMTLRTEEQLKLRREAETEYLRFVKASRRLG